MQVGCKMCVEKKVSLVSETRHVPRRTPHGAPGAAVRQSAGGHEAEGATRVPWLGTACAEPQQSHHPGSPEHRISLAAKTDLPPSSYSKCRAGSQAVREASRIP